MTKLESEASHPTGPGEKARNIMSTVHAFAARVVPIDVGRAQGELAAGTPRRNSDHGCYRFGDWQLDLQSEHLIAPDGASVALTSGEYSLLVAFLDAPYRALSRDHLAQAICVHDCDREACIDVHILGLRRKLEADPRTPEIILTERGAGYRFALAVERA